MILIMFYRCLGHSQRMNQNRDQTKCEKTPKGQNCIWEIGGDTMA